jgi:thiol-disulfide isomerase/thioredoxin
MLRPARGLVPVFLATILSMVATSAWHPSSALADEPDPRALLDQATKAIAAAPSVTYKASLSTKGQIARMYGTFEDTTVTVGPWTEVADASFARAFLVKGTHVAGDGRRQVDMAFDGSVVRAIDHDAKSVREHSLVGGFTPMPEYSLILPGFSRRDELVPSPDAKVEYVGRQPVGDVDCDVVRIDRELPAPPGLDDAPEMVMKDIVAIGVEDRLPRRLWRGIFRKEGDALTEEMSISVTASDLSVGEAIDPARFAPPAPEGFELKKGPERSGPPVAIFEPGDRVPDWTLRDADGGKHSLEDFRGRLVLMDFWATWCGPCKMAMPGLQKLHERFGDRGLVVVGISTRDTGDPTAYMRSKGYTYLSLLDGDEVADAYGVQGIPRFFLIGPEGRLLQDEIGFHPDNENKLAARIEGVLKKLAEEGE